MSNRGYREVAQTEPENEHSRDKYEGIQVRPGGSLAIPRYPSNSVASQEEIIQAAGGQKAVDAYKKKLQKHHDKIAMENQRKLEEYRRAQEKNPSSKYLASDDDSAEKPLW